MSSGPTPDVDVSRLESITGGAPELMEDIVDELDESSERLLTALDDALARGDARAAMSAAHTLKGSGAMVAANRLWSVSEAVEQATATGDLEAARKLLGGLRDALDVTVAALRAATARAKEARC